MVTAAAATSDICKTEESRGWTGLARAGCSSSLAPVLLLLRVHFCDQGAGAAAARISSIQLPKSQVEDQRVIPLTIKIISINQHKPQYFL